MKKEVKDWLILKGIENGVYYILIESADSRWESNSWAKKVESITDEGMIEGDWLIMNKSINREKRENKLNEGDIFVVVQDEGSNKYHSRIIYLFKCERGEIKGYGKFLFIEQKREWIKAVKELLNATNPYEDVKNIIKELLEKYGDIVIEAFNEVIKNRKLF